MINWPKDFSLTVSKVETGCVNIIRKSPGNEINKLFTYLFQVFLKDIQKSHKKNQLLLLNLMKKRWNFLKLFDKEMMEKITSGNVLSSEKT